MPSLATRIRPVRTTPGTTPEPAAEPAVETAVGVGVPTATQAAAPVGLARHLLRHSVFAAYGCAHCSRSYERAMLRYDR
ncbi:MAG TPA: hypothetical protein VFR07_09925 [Mycobacteriales bacterium]|jgi:hypothetical protein|nr:hypothetical protein [Mycobacteriales bacterium]